MARQLTEKQKKEIKKAFGSSDPIARVDYAFSGEVFVEANSDTPCAVFVKEIYRRDDDSVLAKVTDINGGVNEIYLDILLGRYNIASRGQRCYFFRKQKGESGESKNDLTSKLPALGEKQ